MPDPSGADPEQEALGMSLPHPAVDVVSGGRGVMLTNREIVGLSSWLVDAVVTETRLGRVPTLVTGPATRITPAVQTLAMSGRLHWVVQLEDERMYDAAEGVRLRFGDGGFELDSDRQRVPEFATVSDQDRAGAAWQVLTSFTVEHRVDARTELGRGVEALSRALVGSVPAGWGLYEPVTERWSPENLTAFARHRMPEPTQFTVVTSTAAGDRTAMVASVLVQRTDRGVEEQVSAVACPAGLDVDLGRIADRCHDALVAVAEQVRVGFGWTHVRPGAADLTEVPRERAAPVPTAVVIGPRGVRALGAERALGAPIRPATAIGPARVPGYVWRLGSDKTSGWDDLIALTQHLGTQRIVAAAPAFAQMLGISSAAD